MATPIALRLSTAWKALTGNMPQQDPGPVREASPADETAAPPADMFSRAYDGFAIGEQWLGQIALNDDTVLKREGGAQAGPETLKLFDALLDDDVAFATWQQRQLALVSRPWEVSPGDDKDPRSVKAADDLRAMLKAVGWDRVTALMLYARWYGYAVGEAIYSIKQHDGRQLVWLEDVVVPDRAWFAFTNAGELRMRTPTDPNGVAVPPNKFWTIRVGGTNDFQPYGTGLAHWCYWPVWFKRNVMQFWALYLEKYGQPTVVGYFPAGSTRDQINDLVGTLTAIGTDSAVALPAPPVSPGSATQDLRPHLLEASRSGGAQSYQDMVEEQNDALRGVILGQPGTSKSTSQGLNGQQADVHKDVRDEVVQADGDLTCDSFNRTIAVWLTLWNHGPDVAPPSVYRNMDDQEDLSSIATRDQTLDRLGWQRTDQSFTETYGEGYERKPEPDPMTLPGMMPKGMPGQRPPATNDNRAKLAAFAAHFAANDPEPLYVYRRPDQATRAAILAWARKAGFTDLFDEADLHVTVLYSRQPVDWFKMDDRWGMNRDMLTVPSGGARKVEPMGDAGIVALVFGSPELRYRHDSMVEQGASHDYDEYLPHVSFAKSSAGVSDPTKVAAFDGPLVFEHEIFEPIDVAPDLPAIAAFSADNLDAIDRFTAELVKDSDKDFMAMGEALRDRIAAFTADGTQLTPAGLRIAMLQAWERFPIDRLARRMALPFTAEHAAAAAGQEVEP